MVVRGASDMKSIGALLVGCALCAGCVPGGSEVNAVATAESGSRMSASVDADDATPEKASLELAGTVWRLVNITSMNDTVDVPDDRAKYTLGVWRGGCRLHACRLQSGHWTVVFGACGAATVWPDRVHQGLVSTGVALREVLDAVSVGAELRDRE